MKVLFFWEKVGGLTLAHRCNPYAGLLAGALSKRGIHLELGDYGFTEDWLCRQRAECGVLHLNWLHEFYRTDELETTREHYVAFAQNLACARDLGYRIIWTLHNLYPHERPFPEIDHAARLLVSEAADVVIAHCRHAAQLATEHFDRSDNIEIIPHGHFIDVYPNEVPREEARQRLQIAADSFVYLFFGNARAYKAIESLIEAFAGVGAEDAELVLMMRVPDDSEYGDELERRAATDGRVRMFRSDYFDIDDFQLYLNSADAVTLPFSEVLTSGSAITALSFGKPVILPRRGCLPELIDETMGILFEPRDGGLEQALADIRSLDVVAMGRAAHRRALEFGWDGIAKRLAQVYTGGIDE